MTVSKPAEARWTIAGALFVLALALRLLFLWATPDAGWAHSAWYKGDAATWLDWAGAIRESRPFEADLPVRPPGAAYLIAALWDGTVSGISALKIVWCSIGALTVVPLYLGARRAFGAAVALAVGILCAGSTGLMTLSTSLNNETPYLFLVAVSIALTDPLRQQPRTGVLVLWSGINALACLIRAEHILYFALVLAFLFWAWARAAREGGAGHSRLQALTRTGLALAVFLAALAPWHHAAWSQIRRFNTAPGPIAAATEEAQARLERLLGGIKWSNDALAELDRMPAATRRTMRLFVTATEGVRGRSRVTAASFEVLDQAFGTRPRPLAYPYLALYGGLNFYLANHPDANGGFGRAPLERPPPLEGGTSRYPLALVGALPPPQLTLTYPPHLEAINNGYRLGWNWVRDHPAKAVRLAGRKLGIFWSGATLGLGGYNLPLGLSGLRRQVDLVVPKESAVTALWRGGLLLLVLTGAWFSRSNPAMAPWTLLLAVKLIVTLAFFGYARQGASVIPVVALLAIIAISEIARLVRRAPERRLRSATLLSEGSGRRRSLVVASLLLLAVEAVRFVSTPEVSLDQHRIGKQSPFATHEHRDRRVAIE